MYEERHVMWNRRRPRVMKYLAISVDLLHQWRNRPNHPTLRWTRWICINVRNLRTLLSIPWICKNAPNHHPLFQLRRIGRRQANELACFRMIWTHWLWLVTPRFRVWLRTIKGLWTLLNGHVRRPKVRRRFGRTMITSRIAIFMTCASSGDMPERTRKPRCAPD